MNLPLSLRNLSLWAQKIPFHNLLILLGTLALLSEPAIVFGDSHKSEEVLVRVFTKTAQSYVGTLVTDLADKITIFDIETGKERTILKRQTIRIDKPLTLDEATRSVGLPTVAGWKVSQMASREKPVGKISQVTSQVVYITLGKQDATKVGQDLTVYRNKGAIKDPDTGEVLAMLRPKIAKLVVTEVNEKYSKAKIVGELEVSVSVGDEVEPEKFGLTVAVCPLLNEDGTLTNVGQGLAEDLTTSLVQKNVTVVERSVLDMVLSELLAQNSILFDPQTAQKLGDLAGANVVLTGKIVPDRNTGKAYVRLIDVQTGKILFAASDTLNLKDAIVIGRASSGNRAMNARTDDKPSGSDVQSERLGFSRALPSYLTSDGKYERLPGEGIWLQGHESFTLRTTTAVTTKANDYLNKDFTFSVKLKFGHEDKIAYVGLGRGRPHQSYNGLEDSVYLRFHAPDLGRGLSSGLVDVTTFRKGGDEMGKVLHGGTHTVTIIKEGDAVTFHVDPESDGPSDDDLELTIPDIRIQAPFFHSKNMPLFFAGGGIYSDVSLVEGKAIYPKSPARPGDIVNPQTKLDSKTAPTEVMKSKEIAKVDDSMQKQSRPVADGAAFVNSVGMKLIAIPAGEFFLGSSTRDQLAKDDEHPRRKVTISRSFYMGAYEVTTKQYSQVMRTGAPRKGTENRSSGNHSWNDAFDFCQRLSELPEERAAGRSYRLPTEAEWEYACRAGSTTTFFWGEDLRRLSEFAPTIWPSTDVGTLKPNAWGLYDMQGNVTEWCNDLYSPNAYGIGEDKDPQGSRTGRERVHRGANGGSPKNDYRSAARWHFRPDQRYPTLGIRVVCEINK